MRLKVGEGQKVESRKVAERHRVARIGEQLDGRSRCERGAHDALSCRDMDLPWETAPSQPAGRAVTAALISRSWAADGAAGRVVLPRLHRVDHSFDRRLAPHPMRWIARGASNALSLDQPADGLRRLGRKSLHTLDLGGETLQLRELPAVSCRGIDEKGRNSNDERCRTAPAGQRRTDVNARRRGNETRWWAPSGGAVVRDDSHVRSPPSLDEDHSRFVRNLAGEPRGRRTVLDHSGAPP